MKLAHCGLWLGILSAALTSDARAQVPVQLQLPTPARSAAVDVATERALEWLVAHQQPDGSWSSRDPGAKDPVGVQENLAASTLPRTGATGLAVLALLSGSPLPLEGKNLQSVNIGLGFLLGQVKAAEPANLSGDSGDLVAHAMALRALLEADRLLKDERLRPAAQSALQFLQALQGADGGWGRFKGKPSQMQVSVWQLAALRDGGLFGIEVPRRSVARTIGFLNSTSQELGSSYVDTLPPMEADARAAAAGHWMRLMTGWNPRNPALLKGLETLVEQGPAPGDPLQNYFATQAIFLVGGVNWERWNTALRDRLVASQSTDGDPQKQRGSWRGAEAVEGDAGGRLMETALAVLMLKTHERYQRLYPDAQKSAAKTWVEALREAYPEHGLVYKRPVTPEIRKVVRNPAHWIRYDTYTTSIHGKEWYWFRGLGYPKDGTSYGLAISDDGNVVAGEIVTPKHVKGVFWKLAVEADVYVLEGPYTSRFHAISADGSVIGGSMEHTSGCVWTAASGLKEIGYLPGLPRGEDETHNRFSSVDVISPDGKSIFGTSNSSAGMRPYRWSAEEGMIDLEGADGHWAFEFTGVSAGGIAVGRCAGKKGPELYQWTRADGFKFRRLGSSISPGKSFGQSADGRVTFGTADPFLGRDYGAIWIDGEAGKEVGYSEKDLYRGFPMGTSADGSVVFGGGTKRGEYVAFVWDKQNGTRLLTSIFTQCNLKLPGWKSFRIHSISANGKCLVGNALNPQGITEGWTARLPLP